MLDTTPPPVLLVVFNRPDVTARALAALRSIEPPTMFVAADGPRAGHPGDAANCAKVRDLIGTIDWPCEVHRLEHDENLGLQVAMVTAVDWFFANVDRGVVLEDDCLCHPDFFALAEVVLDRHADDPSVAFVTATNLAPDRSFGDGSWFYASGGNVWGWATWRRAWSGHRTVIERWGAVRDDVARRPSPVARSLVRKADEAAARGVWSWARAWHTAVLASGARVVVPARNLVRNVGFGPDATNTRSSRHRLSGLPVDGLGPVLVPPLGEDPSREYDLLLGRYHTRSIGHRLRLRRRRAR